MRKPEQRLYATMRANAWNSTRIERVENGVGTGMPDVHLIRGGVTRWVELKVVRRPALATTALFNSGAVRDDQVAWHVAYHRCGGISFVLARDDRRQLYLFPGADAPQLHVLPLDVCLAHYSRSSWHEIYEGIFLED